MARTADEIEAEIDLWIGQRETTQVLLSSLGDQVAALQSRLDSLPPGKEAELSAALDGLASKLEAAETRAQAQDAKIQALTEQLARQPSPPEPPKPPANQDDPPSPPPRRKTASGLEIL